jgi:hypothetical protein
VPRVWPRPGLTIGPGQPEALPPSCRVVLVPGGRPIVPGPFGHLYPRYVYLIP